MQSLICAFDCAQVLAEWVNAVQERVRPFMGKFGDAECDLMSIEALMMLENAGANGRCARATFQPQPRSHLPPKLSIT